MKFLILLLFVLYGSIGATDTKESKTQEVNVLAEIEFLFTRLSTNPDSTFRSIKKIEEICIKQDILLGIAHCNRFYGKYHQFTGEFPNSLKSFQLALTQIKKYGSEKDLGLIKRDLGEYYRAVNNSGEAKKCLFTAERIFKKLNDSLNLARTYNRLSATCFENSQKDIAYQYALKSLSLIDKNQNKALQSNNYTLIGIMQTNKDSIEYYYLLSKDLAEEENSKIELITIYANIAMFYNKYREIQKAIEYGNKSYNISMENTFKSGIARSAKILATVYSSYNNYERAFYFLDIAYRYRDTISSEKKLQEIYDFNTKRELELQELQFSEQRRIFVFAISAFILMLILGATFIFVVLGKNKKLKATGEELSEKNQLITLQNKDLISLNATKDKFFSIIAHDLRNPVSAFGMASEYIKHELENLDKEHLKELLNELSENSTQLSSLLENLLTWSRAQRKAIQLNKIEFQLTYLINSIFGVLNTTANHKGIKLVTIVERDFQVYGDTNVINTILRNLASNAVKYCKKGDNVTISAKKTTINDIVYSEISVSDTGIGMDDLTLSSLFKIESNISNPGTNGESGTGLGLILCKEFAELHDGCIKVESELGKGSTFFVLLPEHNQKV